jgi:hypothetical protein
MSSWNNKSESWRRWRTQINVNQVEQEGTPLDNQRRRSWERKDNWRDNVWPRLSSF